MYQPGDRVWIPIQPGVEFPGVVVSQPSLQQATSQNGRTFQAMRVDVISMRETNPANGPVETYYRLSNEPESFLKDRDDAAVVGIDVDEDGHILGLKALKALVGNSITSLQERRRAFTADPAATATVEADL